MDATEIRNTFGHNVVYSTGYSGFADEDLRQLLRLNILASGELAAQLAEAVELKREENGHGKFCDCQTCADGQQGKYRPK